MNKLNNFLVLHKSIKLVLTLLIFGSISQIKAQERVPFDQGKKYILADVAVIGKISFNAQTVVTFAGLEKGKEIVTASGMIGKINKIENGIVTLQVANNVFIRVTKSSISKEMTESLSGVLKDEAAA